MRKPWSSLSTLCVLCAVLLLCPAPVSGNEAASGDLRIENPYGIFCITDIRCVNNVLRYTLVSTPMNASIAFLPDREEAAAARAAGRLVLDPVCLPYNAGLSSAYDLEHTRTEDGRLISRYTFVDTDIDRTSIPLTLDLWLLDEKTQPLHGDTVERRLEKTTEGTMLSVDIDEWLEGVHVRRLALWHAPPDMLCLLFFDSPHAAKGNEKGVSIRFTIDGSLSDGSGGGAAIPEGYAFWLSPVPEEADLPLDRIALWVPHKIALVLTPHTGGKKWVNLCKSLQEELPPFRVELEPF